MKIAQRDALKGVLDLDGGVTFAVNSLVQSVGTVGVSSAGRGSVTITLTGDAVTADDVASLNNATGQLDELLAARNPSRATATIVIEGGKDGVGGWRMKIRVRPATELTVERDGNRDGAVGDDEIAAQTVYVIRDAGGIRVEIEDSGRFKYADLTANGATVHVIGTIEGGVYTPNMPRRRRAGRLASARAAGRGVRPSGG